MKKEARKIGDQDIPEIYRAVSSNENVVMSSHDDFGTFLAIHPEFFKKYKEKFIEYLPKATFKESQIENYKIILIRGEFSFEDVDSLLSSLR